MMVLVLHVFSSLLMAPLGVTMCLRWKIMEMPFRWERTGQSLDTFHNVTCNIVLLQLKYSERLQEQKLERKPLQRRSLQMCH